MPSVDHSKQLLLSVLVEPTYDITMQFVSQLRQPTRLLLHQPQKTPKPKQTKAQTTKQQKQKKHTHKEESKEKIVTS